MGSQGSFLYQDGEGVIIPAHKVAAVDTTAAGDTLCGGLVVGMAEGKTLEEFILTLLLKESEKAFKRLQEERKDIRQQMENIRKRYYNFNK